MLAPHAVQLSPRLSGLSLYGSPSWSSFVWLPPAKREHYRPKSTTTPNATVTFWILSTTTPGWRRPRGSPTTAARAPRAAPNHSREEDALSSPSTALKPELAGRLLDDVAADWIGLCREALGTP